MTLELEALVGHLHVVGGRAVSAPPPGALVELAPKRAPRGRERDAFFCLVLPTEGAQAKAVFYERMAQLATERYFSGQGGVAAGLRDVLALLNDNLLGHNQEHPDQPFNADIICMVLRQQEVYIARTGGGLALLWHDGGLETFPYDLDDSSLKYGRPLGAAPEAALNVARYDVQPGHRIVLAGANVAAAGQEALLAVGGQDGIQGIVNRLRALRLPSASALVVELISPDAPDPIPPPKAPTGALSPAKAEAVAPAQTAATSSVQDVAPAQAVSEPAATAEAAPALAPGSVSKAAAARSAHLVTAKPRRFKFPRLRGEAVRRSAQSVAAVLPRPSLEEIQTGSQNIFRRIARGVLRAVRWLILRLLKFFSGLRRVLDKTLPEPEAGRAPSVPTPIAAGAAVLIPVAVVLLVVGLAVTMRDETSFERCLSQAEIVIGVARQASAAHTENELQAWYQAMESINQCAPRRPDDPVLLTLRSEAQQHIDVFARVIRCPVTPVRRYQQGADLRGPVLLGGTELYTLDVSRSILYRDLLNDTGNALTRESEVIVQRGGAVGEYVIRNLVDIAWITEGGTSRRSALIALDSDGVLLSYSPTFPPATAQGLIGADRWIRPVAIAVWQGRLYILDPPAQQVWRYQPSGGAYPGAPEEYFVGETRPDLSNAVDIAIHEGDLYVLFSDGSMQKFNAGLGTFFQFANLPSGFGTLGSASAMYLDSGLISPGFYVLDAANQIIYETTLSGTFIRSYREPEGASFRELSGLTVDDTAQNVYLLARNMLYHFRRPPTSVQTGSCAVE